MTSAPCILTERLDEGVVVLTLNRPRSRNPLDRDTILAMHAEIERLEKSPEPPRVLVVTGAPPAFSAGGDLKKYLELYRDRAAFSRFLDELASLLDKLEKGPFVSIAMINGVCAAGGLELVLSCDLAVAGESATIGDAHANFGQLPGSGGSQRLVRAVGVSRAKEMLLSGRLYSAREAQSMGIVSHVFADGDLREGTLALAREAARLSPLAVERMKYLVSVAVNTPQEEGLRIERDVVLDYATTSDDAREGLIAFTEKRAPRFTGR